MEEEQMQVLGAPDPSVQLKQLEFISLLDECSFEFDEGLQFSLSQEDSDDNSKQKVDLLNTGGNYPLASELTEQSQRRVEAVEDIQMPPGGYLDVEYWEARYLEDDLKWDITICRSYKNVHPRYQPNYFKGHSTKKYFYCSEWRTVATTLRDSLLMPEVQPFLNLFDNIDSADEMGENMNPADFFSIDDSGRVKEVFSGAAILADLHVYGFCVAQLYHMLTKDTPQMLSGYESGV
ncbi:MAG: hypothetical protein GY795_37725, partial [Desulfobacterales bacterium]|nr:hypothetical protein [Desulfobacterales bacterium]